MSAATASQSLSLQESASGERTWTRIGAAIGVLSIIVTTIGFGLHGNMPIGKSSAEIVTWATALDAELFGIGIYVELLGHLLFLTFSAWLWSVVHRSENGSDWLATAGLVAAVVFVGICALDDGIWSALHTGASQSTDSPALTLTRETAEQVSNVSFFFGGLFSLLIGVVVLKEGSLPRWAGVSAVMVGVVALIPPTALLATLFLELWVVVVSVFLLARPDAVRGVANSMATV